MQSIIPNHPGRGRWHGVDRYFGLHYDLHAVIQDTELGLHTGPEELAAGLALANPDFVQTDCKGHPGVVSWFSQVRDASIPPELQADALAGWRAATRRMGLPLHCHYSGIWDEAAGGRHPEWIRLDKDGQACCKNIAPGMISMCPRGEYLDLLMIPQLLELVDRYEVDGFWIDGDLWASEPCYCARCQAEFTARTGISEPPRDPGEEHWDAWIRFALDSYYEYVQRYVDAVHNRKPGVLVCANWLQTFRNPGAPIVTTDWISGDNSHVWGLDDSRCEARFISTRGKPWDIMLWAFYRTSLPLDPLPPFSFKPLQMLQQEAAVTLALGGSLQVYEHPSPVRSGQLIPWRMKVIGAVSEFAHARRAVCQGTESLPQVAVLHSETHTNHHRGRNLMWGVDTKPVQGAVFALLENHYGGDVLDEWALLQRLEGFSVIVVPEQEERSAEMVVALKAYASQGGRLLLSGAGMGARFGAGFLGVHTGEVKTSAEFYLCAKEQSSSVQQSVPVTSASWTLLQPEGAQGMGRLGLSSLLDERLLDAPVWTWNGIGLGAVAWLPFDLFRFFEKTRYPLLRRFVGEVLAQFAGRLAVRISAPTCIDAILRRKVGQIQVHLLNRLSGLPNNPSNGAVDEIPPAGPVTVEIDLPQAPASVSLVFEDEPVTWDYRSGVLCAEIARVWIHSSLLIELIAEPGA